MPLVTDLNDDVLTEILLRLPPRSVLRSRAVCKHWHRAATCASFLAAYSRRRPLELIINKYECRRGTQAVIEAVPLDDDHSDGSRRLLDYGYDLALFASCDGLLLFWLSHRTFVICNPATRQCATFPALAPTSRASVVPSGFYIHRPSGELRVLCFAQASPPVHYVFSTSAAQPRRLGPFGEHRGNHPFPPCGVDVGGILHWVRHPWTGKNSSAMLAFDTVSETFRRILLPTAATKVSDYFINLFDMRGTLAASALGVWPYMDVWALDDYDGERWSHNVRVELLPAAATVPLDLEYGEAVAALEGDVLVLFASGGWATLYDVKEQKTVRVIRRGDNRDVAWRVHRVGLRPAMIHGLPCTSGSGAVPFHDQVEAEFAAIHYSLPDETT